MVLDTDFNPELVSVPGYLGLMRRTQASSSNNFGTAWATLDLYPLRDATEFLAERFKRLGLDPFDFALDVATEIALGFAVMCVEADREAGRERNVAQGIDRQIEAEQTGHERKVQF